MGAFFKQRYISRDPGISREIEIWSSRIPGNKIYPGTVNSTRHQITEFSSFFLSIFNTQLTSSSLWGSKSPFVLTCITWSPIVALISFNANWIVEITIKMLFATVVYSWTIEQKNWKFELYETHSYQREEQLSRSLKRYDMDHLHILEKGKTSKANEFSNFNFPPTMMMRQKMQNESKKTEAIFVQPSRERR